MLRDDVGRLAELHRGLIFPFSGYDLRPALSLGLSFLRHGVRTVATPESSRGHTKLPPAPNQPFRVAGMK